VYAKIVRKMGWCLLLFAKQTARCKTGVVRYHCALPKTGTKKTFD
jgi:hypothetical protein